MTAFLIYMLKTAICLAIVYIFMKAFLSRETFFRFNRIVLLAGIWVCIVLPLIQLKIEKMSPVQTVFTEIERNLIPNEKVYAYYEEVDALQTQSAEVVEDLNPINWTLILFLIYIVGLIINLGILLRSVFAMFQIINLGQKIHFKNYALILVKKNICPFSWGKYIVLSESDYANSPDEIITHELAHIRHRHSFDLLFMEVVLLLQWFNPAMWLLRRELKDIHEYQADMSVLQSGIDAQKYQLLLVKKAVGASSYTLANSFNHSKIKKRITMMLKNESNKWARLKLLLVLPLGLLSVYAFARPEMNPQTDTLSDKSINISSETVAPDEEKEEVAFVSTMQDGKKRTVRFVPAATQQDGKQKGEQNGKKRDVLVIMKEAPYLNDSIWVPLAMHKEDNVKTRDDIVTYVVDDVKYKKTAFLTWTKGKKNLQS